MMGWLSMPNLFVWRAALFVSLGSALTGYYDGSMSGILEMRGFQYTYHTLYSNDSNSTCSSSNGASSDVLIGMVVSFSGLGSVGGSLLAGWLSDRYSRKYSLLLGGLVTTVGGLLFSTSSHFWQLVMGRVIGGIAIGIFFTTMPIYLSEVSPKDFRGMLTSLIGICYASGILTALCCNIGFSRFHVGWRVAAGIQALLGLLFSLAMLWVPHTPRWLVLKHRDKEAHLVLSKINHHSQEDKCLDTHFELAEFKEATGERWEPCKYLFKWKYISRIFLMLVLFFIFAAVGNFLYYFSATLFCEVGASPFLSALAVGIIMLVAALLLPLFIDKFGRKALLLLGSAVCMGLSGLAATLIMLFPTNGVAMYLVVAIICVYAFSNSSSWLTIPFVINGEIFPTQIRGVTVAITTGFYWFFSFIINLVTPFILRSTIETHGFFYIVAGVNLLSIVVVALALPETKGVSLEQMDTLFSEPIIRCSCGGEEQELSMSSNNDKESEAMADYKPELARSGMIINAE